MSQRVVYTDDFPDLNALLQGMPGAGEDADVERIREFPTRRTCSQTLWADTGALSEMRHLPAITKSSITCGAALDLPTRY